MTSTKKLVHLHQVCQLFDGVKESAQVDFLWSRYVPERQLAIVNCPLKSDLAMEGSTQVTVGTECTLIPRGRAFPAFPEVSSAVSTVGTFKGWLQGLLVLSVFGPKY